MEKGVLSVEGSLDPTIEAATDSAVAGIPVVRKRAGRPDKKHGVWQTPTTSKVDMTT